jgi:glutamine cyclotransferase
LRNRFVFLNEVKNPRELCLRSFGLLGLCLALFALVSACAKKAPVEEGVKNYSYTIVNTWPHDPGAFTQGLIYLNGGLIESTGLNGLSSLRKVDLTTGKVQQQTRLSDEYFGEGMTVIGNRVYQITWRNQKGFVYDLATFAVIKEFTYTGEGWGLTTDGHSLILSDGTATLRFLDPETFQVTRSVEVTNDGQPMTQLNELEYVHGEIYANIWQTNSIARINPSTGVVTGLIDFTGLLPLPDRQPNTDVLNGIAYDADHDRLFVTGKNWPKIFEVKLISK